ncbi:MAG: MFS transporter [Spirochaeta sp.]|nr:MFS transporter [Spirochaeta sp.]
MNTAGGADQTFRAVALKLVAPTYLPVLFLTFSWSALAPAFPQYLAGLGAGVATVGLVVAMKGIGQLASDAPGGFILAAWGLRPVTVFSYLLAIGANIALFATRSVPVITALTFVSGFSTSILLTTVMAMIRMTVVAHFRGRALSGVGGAVRVGMLIGPVVGGVVAERFGVPAIFVLRTVALSLGLAFFVAGTPGALDSPAAAGVLHRVPPSPLATLRHVAGELRGRWFAVVTMGTSILILSVLRSSREIILPLWGRAAGFSPAAIGVAMSIGAAFDLLLFLPAGYISDRWGRRAAAGLCLGGFSAGLVALLPAQTFVPFILAASLIGLGNGFGAGINMTTGADLAPDRSVAEFLGLWRLYGDLGNAAGPIAVGALAAALTLGPAVAITAGIGFLGVANVVFVAPETRDLDRTRPQ